MSFPVLSFPYECAISTDLTVRYAPVKVCDISGHTVRYLPITVCDMLRFMHPERHSLPDEFFVVVINFADLAKWIDDFYGITVAEHE